MNAKTMLPSTFATTAGLILMAVPSLFWLGIALAVGFEKPIIVQQIMLPIDRVSPVLTFSVMIGLPVITFLVNLKAMFMVEFNPLGENLFIDISYHNNKMQWILIIYAAASIVTTITYAFFEHFHIYANMF